MRAELQLREVLVRALSALEIDDGVIAHVESFGDEIGRALVAVAIGQDNELSEHAHRARALDLLAALRWRPALKPVSGLLHDPSLPLRLRAIYAVAAVGGPNAVEPLVEMAVDDTVDVSIRAHALRCLGSIGDRDVAARLAATDWNASAPELSTMAHTSVRRLNERFRRDGSP